MASFALFFLSFSAAPTLSFRVAHFVVYKKSSFIPAEYASFLHDLFLALPTSSPASLIPHLLCAIMARSPRPTPLPNRHILPVHKRQSFVTVSVVANDTDTSTPANSSSNDSSFPVAIAIPALVGGMAVAIAVFGFWWWWSKRSKRVKRVSLELSSHQISAHAKLTGVKQERWEAAQRRKNKRHAAEKDKPTARLLPAGQSQKTPTGEKAFNPILPPLSTAQPYYPPPQTNEYGYAPSQQGYAAWQIQPDIEQVQYGQQASSPPQQGYYSPPAYAQGSAPPLSRDYSSESTIPLTQNIAPPATSPTSPTNSHSSNSNSSGHKSSGSVPPPRRSSSDEKKSSTLSSSPSSPSSKKNPKSSKNSKNSRATARMAVAESAAANASLNRMFRHKPSKPSPLAIKAQQERDAALAANDPLTRISSDETSNPFSTESEGLYPPADSRDNATLGEWGVALGSPDEEDTFGDSQAAVLDNGPHYGAKSSYSEDPYLKKKAQTKSGMYSQDPYALYHEEEEGEEEEEEEDADRYHNAAESMGLGSAGKNKKRDVGKWV